MMDTKGKLATILIALALFGCKGMQTTSAASTGNGTSGGSGDGAATAPSGGGTRVENIVDTTMDNKTAFSVTIPANWKFQGVLLQGGIATCESYFFPVYRASSEDGKSFSEVLPQLLWAYGDGPKPKTGCLPLDKLLSAQDFLKYLSTTMNLAYTSDAPMPNGVAKSVKEFQDSYAQPTPFYAQHNLPKPHNTADGAAALVGYKQNGTPMKGRLTVLLTCTEVPHPGFHSILAGMASTPPTTSGKCSANVGFVTAPESQFDAVVRLWDNPAYGAKQDKDWGWAWVKRYADQGNAANQAMINAVDQRFATQRQAIQHTMAVQQQEHDQFLQTMQEGTDRSMARAADVANSNHRAAQDMVDYSLDRQTILDTNTGNYYKVTNQVTPGGAAQRVHADGTPW
jgi:hypothetical protein